LIFISVFENGVKVYVNPDSIAWGISYILNTPGAVERLSAGGKAKVKEFTWTKAADKILDTYKIVLQK
jgi:glycosyltransferase involved in cell wall biosynthesis